MLLQQVSAKHISIPQKVLERFKAFYAGTGGTEAEAEYDILKDEGKLNIEGTDFGKKDLTVKADREDIAEMFPLYIAAVSYTHLTLPTNREV